MLFNLSTIGALFAVLPALVAAAPNVQRNNDGHSDPHHGYPSHLPKNCDEFKQHHPYHHPPENHRRKIYIRDSKNETDDVSAEFLKGIQQANKGGTLVLPKGKTFVLGKKLDLTFLDDLQVQLDGTILVCSHLTWKCYVRSKTNHVLHSSRTTSPTGKRTISTILSKRAFRFGNGVERISRSLELVFWTGMVKPGMMDLQDWRFSYVWLSSSCAFANRIGPQQYLLQTHSFLRPKCHELAH